MLLNESFLNPLFPVVDFIIRHNCTCTMLMEYYLGKSLSNLRIMKNHIKFPHYCQL
ncbi:unnamed protein product, partial [Schistosoma rodhaini]